ncbi:MAG: hypothetical protein ACYC27_18385 [Armatimonadota bacterium]
MKIVSKSPGNIFVSGGKLAFNISDAAGNVNYRITDYFGRQIIKGTAKTNNGNAVFSIKDQVPGWYQLECSDTKNSLSVSFGVVIDRKGASLIKDGRVCADAASAWLVRNEDYRIPFAKMLSLAGIPMVRERLDWGGVEKQPGKIDWLHYQRTVDTLADEGVQVFQVWHSTPEWTHPANTKTYFPDDLRDVYRFTKSASQHFSKQVAAWEPWNEPDIDFWPDLGDRLAGYAKAAYLGLKDGNPKAMLIQSSLCVGVTPFAENLYESGLGDYFEVFNWHIYTLPSAYPGLLASYRELLSKYKIDGRPSWLTEAGIRIPAKDIDGQKLLDSPDQRDQCRFIPRSVVMSLVAGNDRHFFFVLPDYLENGVQFGSLKPDLTPYPGFLALSASANILGSSNYLGEYKAGSDDLSVHVFTSSKENIAVIWADKEMVIKLPTEKVSVKKLDIFGAETVVPVKAGTISVKAGPDAVYLTGIGNSIKKHLTGKPVPRGKMPELNPSKVVVVGHTDLPINKVSNSYMVESDTVTGKVKPFDFDVEVYNFNDTLPAEGTVNIELPTGWTTDNPSRKVVLEPMGRAELKFSIIPGSFSLDRTKVKITADYGNEKVSPSVSYFQFDANTLEPASRKALDWIKAEKWIPSASDEGSVSISNLNDNTLLFDVKFNGGDDRWAYPGIEFKETANFNGFDGIGFNMKTDTDDPKTQVQMMLVEKSGAYYIAASKTNTSKHRRVLLFKDFVHLAFMKPDDNNHLDLDQIVGVKFGCNTAKDSLKIELEAPELVKF